MNKLKEVREQKGLSITELARLSNVSRQTIYRLEDGKDEVANSQTLRALADALGIRISEFFEPSV